jgi:hypothetical protein
MQIRLRLRGSAIVRAGVLGAVLSVAGAGFAQEKGDKGPEVHGAAKEGLPAKGLQGEPVKEPEYGFLQSPAGIRISASLQMMAIPNPIAALGVRLAAASGEVGPLLWPEWEVALDAPPPLPFKYLADLQDGTPIPQNLAQKDPKAWTPDERAYLHILNDALINARLVPAKLFEDAAKKQEYVTFDDLWRNPAEYRGEIVPLRGRMIRLRRHKTPTRAQASGIEYVYEAWVVGQTPKRNPYCILFTDLPPELQPQETMDQPVRFNGYYVKKFRYDADKAVRMTHLLIGPTVYPEPVATPPAPYMPFSRMVLFGIMGGSLALFLALVAMALWFRRGDKAIHSKLASLREQTLNLSDEEAPDSPSGAKPGEPQDGA